MVQNQSLKQTRYQGSPKSLEPTKMHYGAVSSTRDVRKIARPWNAGILEAKQSEAKPAKLSKAKLSKAKLSKAKQS